MPRVKPKPNSAVPKSLRFLLDCGHQRIVMHGTRRLTKVSKALLLTHYQERKLWCYLCAGYQKPERLLGVELTVEVLPAFRTSHGDL